MPNYAMRTKNAVHISPSNSITHEIKKLEVCYNLRKNKQEFITECVPNKEPNRRIDIVCLDTGERIEIEVSGKPKADADITYLFKGGNRKRLVSVDKWEVIYK